MKALQSTKDTMIIGSGIELRTSLIQIQSGISTREAMNRIPAAVLISSRVSKYS
jgi:hypothetical protein